MPEESLNRPARPTKIPAPASSTSARHILRHIWPTLATIAVFILGLILLIPAVDHGTERYWLDHASVDFTFQVVDDSNGLPIPGATVRLIRPASEIGQDERILAVETDAKGRAVHRLRCRTIGVTSLLRTRASVAFPLGWFDASAEGFEPAPRVWLISRTGMSRDLKHRNPPVIRISLHRLNPAQNP